MTDGTDLPDLLYVVREGPNPSLRYSLRSVAANFPHARVFLSGHIPTWVKGVQHVPVRPIRRTRWENSTHNLRVACEDSDLSESFVLMNDDFFVMRKVYPLRVYNRGLVSNLLRYWKASGWHNEYSRGLAETYRILMEVSTYRVTRPVCFSLHVPMTMDRHNVLEAYHLQRSLWSTKEKAFHFRTFYGNMVGLLGTTIPDVKISDANDDPRCWWEPGIQKLFDGIPFLSTSSTAFRGRAGRYIRDTFPTKCAYEKK